MLNVADSKEDCLKKKMNIEIQKLKTFMLSNNVNVEIYSTFTHLADAIIQSSLQRNVSNI